jgi:hypothetical protein
VKNDKNSPKALFLSAQGRVYPDSLICSGSLPVELKGQACPYSVKGRMSDLAPLDKDDEGYSVDKGKVGDLCPPCAEQQLANLGHWQGYKGQTYPDESLSLRLFKCRQGFWFVVLGLKDSEPTAISNHEI